MASLEGGAAKFGGGTATLGAGTLRNGGGILRLGGGTLKCGGGIDKTGGGIPNDGGGKRPSNPAVVTTDVVTSLKMKYLSKSTIQQWNTKFPHRIGIHHYFPIT